MQPKIFVDDVDDVCCLAMPPNECACMYTITCYSLCGHFY